MKKTAKVTIYIVNYIKCTVHVEMNRCLGFCCCWIILTWSTSCGQSDRASTRPGWGCAEACAATVSTCLKHRL